MSLEPLDLVCSKTELLPMDIGLFILTGFDCDSSFAHRELEFEVTGCTCYKTSTWEALLSYSGSATF